MKRADAICRTLLAVAVLAPLPACTMSLEPIPPSATVSAPANLANCPYIPRNPLARSCRP
jgi:hypothetical protein